ncbi:MAG: tyrosine--tRNA ligase [Candidatus Peregrinibacteria bacterium]|nr:tyrosine--tRNA ligase [Candidatus Peregrinibacteria bacterium]MDZ4245076.1 tyrosine--tRNA ligase [Candidatus Gracilibacteria bacterium]
MELKEQVNDILTRGVTNVIVKEELEKVLLSGKKIKLYLGIDPTGSELHIGHAVPLRKLRRFQELGHEIILLFGGFTAQLGDPTGKDITRPPLTYEQVMINAETYKEQAATILDFEGENPVKILNNNDWLSKMNFADVIKLAGNFTVQQMMERDMFQERFKNSKPIGVHEFLYPLMQGYDSVAMDVDLELGGNDQLFNILAGRTLQEKINGRAKHCMTFDLLEGTDGRKMSKSYNNHIAIGDEPRDMFGKIMSIKDELITQYFTLATELTLKEIEGIKKELKSGTNPRDLKVQLAKEIVTLYHDEAAADDAEEAFVNQFARKELPDDIEEISIGNETINLLDLLYNQKMIPSKAEGRRLMEQGGVKVNGEKIDDPHMELSLSTEKTLLQVGKRKFLYIKK